MGRRLARVVAVIAGGLAGDQHVQGMMQIVVPLRAEALDPAAAPRQAARLVAVVFEDEMNRAIGDAPAHRLADLVDDVGRAVVEDGMNRIEAQPVEMKFVEPVERVVDEEIAHWPAPRPGEVDRGPPRRLVALGKKIGRVPRQIISFRSEMIVDDIEEHGEAAGVAGFDQRLQPLRRAVTGGSGA